MKRLILALVLVLAVSPAWALFCQYCGKPMADDARFCPQCGKAQAAAVVGKPTPEPVAPTTAPVTGHINTGKPTTSDVIVNPPAQAATPAPTAELLLTPYEPINRYETLLTSAKFDAASRGVPEYRARISTALQHMGPETPRFGPVMQKIHSLYLKKYDLLDRYFDAWNRSEKGPGKVEAEAQKEKTLFTIARINEMIVALKDHHNDATVLTRLDEMQRELDSATAEHLVTDPYLRIEGHKVEKGKRFWVMDIVDGRAKVMVLSECGTTNVVTGWVSLYDLEHRTTFRVPAGSIVEPIPVVAPVTREVVIVGHDPWWPGWHRHYGWGGPRHW